MSLSYISGPENASLVRNDNEVTVTVNTDLPLTTANLKIQTWLMVETVYDSGTYNIFARQTLDPDQDGNCKFFWHNYLKDAFDRAYDQLTNGSTAPVQSTKTVLRYYFVAIERSGEPQDTTDYLLTGPITTPRYAINGGISKQRYAVKPYFGATGWHGDELEDSFLDNLGTEIRTFITQDQWAPFFWHDNASNGNLDTFALDIRLFKSDGTTQVIQVHNLTNIDKYQLHYLPVGFTQLNLTAYETPTVKVVKYMIQASGTTHAATLSQISHARYYHVRRQHMEFQHFISYQNSLGTISTIALNGRRIRDVEIQKDLISTYWEAGMDSRLGEGTIYDVLASDHLKFGTGTITRSEQRQMLDLLHSRHLQINLGSDQENVSVKVAGLKWTDTEDQNIVKFDIALAINWQNEIADVMAI